MRLVVDDPLAHRALDGLLDAVWGYDPTVESRTVDWHMAELRRKLEPEGDTFRHLQTVRKVGYRLELGDS
jgi:two-component system response regulator RegX3